MIALDDISKRYGSVVALDSVSIRVERGEIVALTGCDGAGKSTLLRIITTLLLPDSGSGTVGGYDIHNQTAGIRRVCGYMPEKFSLYEDLTVEENLNFYATIYGTSIRDGYESIKSIYSQIERFKDRRAGALSGGMKQKLALCCALVHRPQLLVLDEPTTGVDPVSRKEFWDTLGTINKGGVTVIVATPYIDEIKRCHRAVFIDKGTVMGTGSPDDILTRFADIFSPGRLKMTDADAHTGQTDVIKVSHLIKSFGHFRAVDDISFNVRKGEIFGFLGANGAGKTTAMRMLTGLSQPTGGHAEVAGYDIATQYEKVKTRIGYMSQKFSLYGDLTVKENLRLFGGIYGMKDEDIRRSTDEAVTQLNMKGLENKLVRELPPGWKQKIAFTVSIMHSPEVVFLDEPTGGVDPKTRKQFWRLIYEAAGRGITVFVTTHYMDEAEYCDRISIMVDGQIRAIGTPDELKSKYSCADMDGIFTKLAMMAKRGD